MKNNILTVWVCFYILSCGGGLGLSSMDKDQPQVTSVYPVDGATLDAAGGVTVALSTAVDPTTVHNKSFLVTPDSTNEVSLMTASDILSNVSSGDIASLEGDYSVSDDGKNLKWTPASKLESGVSYAILLTSAIQTVKHYPLNQTPGTSPTFFISHFTIMGASEDEGESNSSTASVTTSVEVEIVMINEIYYDDSTSDTDGHAFIELYGTSGGSLAGYTLRLVNGADGTSTDDITFPAGTQIPEDGFFVVADKNTGSDSETHVTNADYLDNFDPQNGPDSVQLFDPYGTVVDVVGYGDGLPETDVDGSPMYEVAAGPSAPSGQSLSRVNGTDAGNNANDFVVNTIPSPGSGEVTMADSEATDEDASSSSSTGDNSTSGSSTSDSSTSEISDSSITESTASTPLFQDVHFTEVVTDPQQDWNDTSGGDGISFNAVPGNDTIGSTDEWLEIKNDRSEAVDLTHWNLEMIDGTDESLIFGESSATFSFSDGGNLSYFQPGEFLIIGNPEGDMKNTLTLNLLDDQSDLVDSLSIDDANADGTEDESYQVESDGTWSLGEATIGF